MLPVTGPDTLGTWEAHATGWLRAPLPLCLLRYEAMQATPLTEFRRAVRFLGLAHPDVAITAALESSRFERLQRQEAAQRFRETPLHGIVLLSPRPGRRGA